MNEGEKQSINILFSYKKISRKAYQICLANKIEFIEDLFTFYQSNKSFLSLRYIDFNTNTELIDFCKTYGGPKTIMYDSSLWNKRKPKKADSDMKEILLFENIEVENKKYPDLSIKKLLELDALTFKAYSACGYNHLYSLNDIIRHYNKNRTFLNLPNLGQKTNDWLIELCNKVKDGAFIYGFTTIDSGLETIVNQLSDLKISIINSFIEINFNNLSVRSHNALNIYLSNKIDVKTLIDKVYNNKYFDVTKISNVGRTCFDEITAFINSVESFVVQVNENDEMESLIYLNNQLTIKRKFDEVRISETFHQKLPLLKIVEYLLEYAILFDQKKTIIFKNCLGIYHDQDAIPYELIANEVRLSPERVRQIRNNFLSDFTEKLDFLPQILDDQIKSLIIDNSEDYVYISDEKASILNKYNGTKFSKPFITLILSIYLQQSHSLVGNTNDTLLTRDSKIKNRHRWQNNYLVKNSITNEFDFDELITHTLHRYGEPIPESYNLNFKNYITAFLKTDQLVVSDELSKICSLLISNEFRNIHINDDQIMFSRNTYKQVYEYVEELLQNYGQPMHLSTIYEFLQKDYQNCQSEQSLRTNILRSDKISCISRTSTYGLKSWETISEDFKGGTIKDIISDHLSNHNEPIHILELLNVVNIYRTNTTENNVLTNLKLDPKQKFVIFNTKFYRINFQKI